MHQTTLKEKIGKLQISDFDYPLPDESIAKYPLKQRDLSKLLLIKEGSISEDIFINIGNHLPKDAMLVWNETRVINARLLFTKDSGAVIELFCLEPAEQSGEIQEAFARKGSVHWNCMIGNSKKWKNGILKQQTLVEGKLVHISAERTQQFSSYSEVHFQWDNPTISFAQLVDAIGQIPLPPYLHRQAEAIDLERYQTVYARNEGSVAAPTAGLHFTPEVIHQLQQQGFSFEQLTLHVGAGTFKPVSSDAIEQHAMHKEQIIVSKKTIQHLKNHKGKRIAIGTTSMRTLESLYWLGLKVKENTSLQELNLDQWFAYENASNELPKVDQSLEWLLTYLDNNHLQHIQASTALMIAPGYQFRIVDGLITNFHQPKSTLLLLVAAMIGDKWREAYAYALKNDFRFLSYGDSSLILP